jgi:N-acetylmuramoyl-L-alanine amidase
VVTIPDPQPDAGIKVRLDGRTELLQRRRDRQPLRVTLSNADGTPVANADFTLSFGSGELRGRTDPSGLLTVQLPLDADELHLRVDDYEWELRMGHLNPLEHTDDEGISGCQGRLKNLGYFDGEIDGKNSPELQQAIRRFQLVHQIPRSGHPDAATRQKLSEEHGC